MVESAENGKTIVSTIDVNIQNIVEKYINEWQTTVGSKVTAAIAMNPNNGEILAMATSNTFDLNNPRDVSGYTEEELMALGRTEAAAAYGREHEGEKISEDQVLDYYTRDEVLSYGPQVAWNQTCGNFCVRDTYEPRSPPTTFTVGAGPDDSILPGNDSVA